MVQVYKVRCSFLYVGKVQEVLAVVYLGDLSSGTWESQMMEVTALQSNWQMKSTGMILLSLSLWYGS